jgi:hypothetical protein
MEHRLYLVANLTKETGRTTLDTVKELASTLMEESTQAHGTITSDKGMACMQVKNLATLAYGKRTSGMGMVHSRIKMARHMWESGVKTLDMAKELTNFLMDRTTSAMTILQVESSEGCTLEDGRMIRSL